MKLIIHCVADIQRLTNVISKALREQGKPLSVDLKPYREKRSLEQNSLYWNWLTIIATHYSNACGMSYSPDDFHEFFRARFLPPTLTVIDQTQVRRYPSTTSLTIDEMSTYLENIKQYCFDDMMLELNYERIA